MADERDPRDDFLESLATQDDAPPPNPRFVRALRGQLMQQAATMPLSAPPPASNPNGRFDGSLSAPISLAPPRQHRLDRRLGLQLAAVALLLLAWIGTLAGGEPRDLFNAARQTDQDESTASMFRGNNARTGAVDDAGPAANPQLAWESTPASAGFVVTNANASTVLLVYETTGRLVALDATSGAERWTSDTGCMFLDTTPLLVDGLVYVGASCPDVGTGQLIVLGEQDGIERWRQAVSGDFDSSPMIEDGVLYVMTSGNAQVVRAFDASDGTEIWTSQIERSAVVVASPEVATTPYIGKLGAFSPAIGGDLLFVTAFDGVVYALSTSDGHEVWRFDSGGNTVSTPAFGDGVIFFSSSGVTDPSVAGNFYALNAETGELLWQAELPDHSPYSGPTLAGNLVILSMHTGESRTTSAYEIASGRKVWSIDQAGSVIYADGVIYLLELDRGEAIALDPQTGQAIWTAFVANYEFPPSEVSHVRSEPVIAGGRLIVASHEDTVIALEEGPSSGNVIVSPGSSAAYDFTGLAGCKPPPPIAWDSLDGEPAASLVPVSQNQEEGLRAAIVPEDLPAGEPVTPDMESSVQAALAGMRACAERTSQADVSGYFSADFYRRTWVQFQIDASPLFDPGWFLRFAAEPDAETTIQVLPDGRVGVEIRVSSTYAHYVVLIDQGGQWVVDELLEVTPYPLGKG